LNEKGWELYWIIFIACGVKRIQLFLPCKKTTRQNKPNGLCSVIYNCYVDAMAAMVARAAEIARERGGRPGALPTAEQERRLFLLILAFL